MLQNGESLKKENKRKIIIVTEYFILIVFIAALIGATFFLSLKIYTDHKESIAKSKYDDTFNGGMNRFCLSNGFKEMTDNSIRYELSLFVPDAFMLECDGKSIFNVSARYECKTYDKFKRCNKSIINIYENIKEQNIQPENITENTVSTTFYINESYFKNAIVLNSSLNISDEREAGYVFGYLQATYNFARDDGLENISLKVKGRTKNYSVYDFPTKDDCFDEDNETYCFVKYR